MVGRDGKTIDIPAVNAHTYKKTDHGFSRVFEESQRADHQPERNQPGRL